MFLPKDPVMLLSVVNTYLRDYHSSLEDLCQDTNLSVQEVIQQLDMIDYHYDSEQNQFV